LKHGDVIERIDTEDFNYTTEEIKLIHMFHKAAHDSYYKVEETIDALFDSLNNDDIIGSRDGDANESSSPDDDDLPF
jgi:hypothetical protein